MPLCGPLPGPPPVPGGLHGTPLVGVPLHGGSVGVGVLPGVPPLEDCVGVGEGAGGVVGVGVGGTGVGDGVGEGLGAEVGVGVGLGADDVGGGVGEPNRLIFAPAVAVAFTLTVCPGVLPATATSAKQHASSRPATMIKIMARLRTPP